MFELWEFISRPFLACDCNNRCYAGEQVIEPTPDLNPASENNVFVLSEKGEIERTIRIHDANGDLSVSVYFCPGCGRRLKRRE